MVATVLLITGKLDFDKKELSKSDILPPPPRIYLIKSTILNQLQMQRAQLTKNIIFSIFFYNNLIYVYYQLFKSDFKLATLASLLKMCF